MHDPGQPGHVSGAGYTAAHPAKRTTVASAKKRGGKQRAARTGSEWADNEACFAGDGTPAAEGAFLACSFWLARVWFLQDRKDEARALFARLLRPRPGHRWAKGKLRRDEILGRAAVFPSFGRAGFVVVPLLLPRAATAQEPGSPAPSRLLRPHLPYRSAPA